MFFDRAIALGAATAIRRSMSTSDAPQSYVLLRHIFGVKTSSCADTNFPGFPEYSKIRYRRALLWHMPRYQHCAQPQITWSWGRGLEENLPTFCNPPTTTNLGRRLDRADRPQPDWAGHVVFGRNSSK